MTNEPAASRQVRLTSGFKDVKGGVAAGKQRVTRLPRDPLHWGTAPADVGVGQRATALCGETAIIFDERPWATSSMGICRECWKAGTAVDGQGVLKIL